MADPKPEVVQLAALIFQHRLKIRVVMERAGLRRTTWSTWAAGAEPKLGNLHKVRTAIEALISEKEAPNGPTIGQEDATGDTSAAAQRSTADA